MAELSFSVLGVEPEPYAAAPALALRLRVTTPDSRPVHAVVLRTAVEIDPRGHDFTAAERAHVLELFGPPTQWSRSLKPLRWAQVTTALGGFEGSTETTLSLPCSYDLEVAHAKLLAGLEHGTVPVVLLFSGTVFREVEGRLSVEPISWDAEARFVLPVSTWRSAMDHFFPGEGWLRLSRETLGALGAFKARQAIPTWEGALESLLGAAGAGSGSPTEEPDPASRADPLSVALDAARSVADAICYEGYVLYPYRASARKNHLRWQFGVLAPPEYAAASGAERADARVDGLFRAAVGTRVAVRVRFLTLTARSLWIEEEDQTRRAVESLEVDGQLWTAFDEGVSHEVDLVLQVAAPGAPAPAQASRTGDGRDAPVPGVGGAPGVAPLGPVCAVSTRSLRLGGARREQDLGRDAGGRRCVAAWEAAPVDLQVVASAGPLASGGGWWVRVEVANTSAWSGPAAHRDDVVRRSVVGVHALFAIDGGVFLSALDRPADLPEAAGALHDGLFPVLVGDEERPRTVLASPIVLSDFPAIAPESAQAMYDATEIDEILALRVLTLTDDEKREVRATDPRAAAVLSGCEELTAVDFERLHARVRPVAERLGARASSVAGGDRAAAPRGAPSDGIDGAPSVASQPGSEEALPVRVAGVTVGVGSRVLLQPNRRADAQDLFLRGRVARVTGVYRTLEGECHLGVVVEDDPAAELHEWYGRSLFFAPEEVVPLSASGDPDPTRVGEAQGGATDVRVGPTDPDIEALLGELRGLREACS